MLAPNVLEKCCSLCKELIIRFDGSVCNSQFVWHQKRSLVNSFNALGDPPSPMMCLLAHRWAQILHSLLLCSCMAKQSLHGVLDTAGRLLGVAQAVWLGLGAVSAHEVRWIISPERRTSSYQLFCDCDILHCQLRKRPVRELSSRELRKFIGTQHERVSAAARKTFFGELISWRLRNSTVVDQKITQRYSGRIIFVILSQGVTCGFMFPFDVPSWLRVWRRRVTQGKPRLPQLPARDELNIVKHRSLIPPQVGALP